MFKLEVRYRKAQCWQSRWRGIGHDGTGHPTHYVPLTMDEMMEAAATGHVQIPESAVPEIARHRQEYMDLMAADMGFSFETLPADTQEIIIRAALEEVLA